MPDIGGPAAPLLRADPVAARLARLLIVVGDREPEAASHRIGFDDPKLQLLTQTERRSRLLANQLLRLLVVGGLGAHVLTMASDEGLLDAGLKIRTMRLPDRFLDQDKPEKQYDEAGLNAPQIVETVLKALRSNSAGVEEVRA